MGMKLNFFPINSSKHLYKYFVHKISLNKLFQVSFYSIFYKDESLDQPFYCSTKKDKNWKWAIVSFIMLYSVHCVCVFYVQGIKRSSVSVYRKSSSESELFSKRYLKFQPMTNIKHCKHKFMIH